MAYSQMLRELFPETTLQAEDMLLLETFQIKYLPDRVAKKEFATLLLEYPVVHRFLAAKYPPAASFLTKLLEAYKPSSGNQKREEQCQEALWEIADLIIYNKHPDLYDQNTRTHWDISDITSITSLADKTVADIGAGSGRIAFLVARHAQTVFAVEPIASFRSFMKEKAVKESVDNLFVMDGTLDSIPLPGDSLDVLITSNAIGWNLKEELTEIERVVKSGGQAIHLLHSDPKYDNPIHKIITSEPWNYHFLRDLSEHTVKIKYHKTLGLQN
jgi:ubiquinone/menaquinone biosynthesis C-methylase UbiE